VSNYLRLQIALQVAAATVLVAAAIALFPVRPEIGGAAGIVFWVCLTLVASALPIQLPAGSKVSVSSAPILAAIVLGGPAVGAIVGVLGSFEVRELRFRIPWYATLNNHAIIAGPAVVGGAIYDAASRIGLDGSSASGLQSVAAIAAAGITYNTLNNLLSAVIVSIRSGQSLSSIWSQDLRIITTNVVALVPLAWLMSQVFQLPGGVGWWATLLFVLPLFTTRLAYSRYVETRELFEQTIGALANAVDARDRYTRGHSQRVSHISEAMCRVMGLSEPEIENIKWAGLLHDIGKIGIRDNVLLKPGPLDREERILMNQHPTIGAEIVAPAHQLNAEAPLIRYHHEWFNGSGYPEGIEALDIPLGARILTVADAYEAMTSSRPYRLTPLTHEQAVGELEKFTGIQFDPEIVPVLVGLDREILDRPPDKPDELPTMLRADDPRDRPRAEKPDEQAGEQAAPDSDLAAIMGPPESGGGRTGTTASGTAITPMERTSPGTTAPSGRKGSPPRQSLASDDVP